MVAIVVNVAQFRTSDRDTDDNFDAIHPNGTADITKLVYNECAWCRDRYVIHLALRVVAPGSTVIVPASSPYRDDRYIADVLGQRLYSLGLVADIEWVSYRRPRTRWPDSTSPGTSSPAGRAERRGRPGPSPSPHPTPPPRPARRGLIRTTTWPPPSGAHR